jgi:hypothetical protein
LTWIIRDRHIKRCNEKPRPGRPGLAATAAWARRWQSARLIGFGGGIDILLRCALRHGEQLASTSDIGGAVSR